VQDWLGHANIQNTALLKIMVNANAPALAFSLLPAMHIPVREPQPARYGLRRASHRAPRLFPQRPSPVGRPQAIYALGIVLHELFTGKRPVGDNISSDLEAAVARVIRACLEPDPKTFRRNTQAR
jgi:hypothetical protein